jgi:heme exporter protein D
MMLLGPYALFIVTSYLATAVVVATLILWVAHEQRVQERHLRELQRNGIVRRSGPGPSG